ncbi:ankyrin domain-containing protein [Campylobacter blaseri]|uniref:hypothetical protein n=1 Tax=Campylobacter blaseri TaxID=2042961 RepID=UPI001882725A|nr:hypothetical protein [Campylobacter blaseri]QKF86960.1 ankyrin domain-containing protein [Campylobacter blaseri]
MKKVLIFILFVFGVLFADELDLGIFYDQNATHKQIDEKLDEILEFMGKNPQMIDEEFQDDRVVFHFIVNLNAYHTHKFDFDRIEKILKFNPDLNYDIFKLSFKTTLLDVAISINTEKEIFYEDEIIKLAEILVKNGYDIGRNNLLNPAYTVNSFKVFSYLLENKAKNTDNLMLAIVFDLGQFINKNGFNINSKKPPQKDMREFVKSEKFLEFYSQKELFLKELFKYMRFKDLSDKDKEFFIKFNTYLDNDKAIKLLLENGIEDDKNSYKTLKNYANEFQSKSILELLTH